MSGAGGNLAMNYLHNVAPRDGSYRGVPLQDLLFNAKLGVAAVRYDGAQAHYLGGADVIRTTVMDDPGFIGEAAMRGLAIHPVPWQLQQDLAAQIALYIGCDA